MNPLFRIPIRWQLIIIVAIVALPAAGIIIYSGVQQRNHAINEARIDAQRLVDRISSEQRILAASALQLVVSVSQLPEVKGKEKNKVNSLLKHLLNLHPNLSTLFISDSTGTIWASADHLVGTISIYDRRYFKNAIAEGHLASGEFHISRILKKPIFTFGYPYKNSHGDIVGVVGVGILLDGYKNLLDRSQLPTNSNIVFIDHNGIVLFSAINPDKYIGKMYNPFSFKKMQEGPDNYSSVEANMPGNLLQNECFINYQKLRLEGETAPYMYVRVGIPVKSALSQSNREIVGNISSFALVLTLALFVSWLVGKHSIVNRVIILKKASRGLADGDFRIRVSDLVKGGELGELGELFDAMAQQLALREKNLSVSQRFLNTIIDTEPDCVKILDSNGRVLLMNPAGLKIMGVKSLEQVKGQSIFSLISTEYRDAFIKLTHDVFKGLSGRLEFEADCFNGRHVWLGTHVVPLRDDAGEIVSLLGITRDITDRKLADQALRQSEANLRKAQEIARIGSWIYNMTDLISWSDEMYRIHGVSPETFTPTIESVLNLIHPDDRPAVQAWIDAVTADEKPGELEFRVIWTDGTTHFISGRAEVVHDHKDRQIHLAGTALDITDRKQAEEARAVSEKAFRATFEQSAVGMALVTPNGHWLLANQRLCDLVGYTRDELLTMTFQEITHPSDRDTDLHYLRQLLAGDIDTTSTEKRYIRKNLSTVWVNLTVGLVRDTSGMPDYFVCVVEDISKRKRSEEALADKQQQLESLNKYLEQRIEDAVKDSRKLDQILIQQGRQAAMGEMIGNIAHQWRQPLNTLGLIVQELQMTYGSAEFNKISLDASVIKAMTLITHMSKTIDDFSNYFKPGKARLLFNVNKTIIKTLSLIEASLANQHIDIKVIENAEVFINGYANEYSQVLLNIFLNCRDAFEKNKLDRRNVVVITIYEENDKSVVTIADNAGGIPADVIAKIFDPYFTTKGPDKGTGIGLYMAKTIIEKNMGGKLTVRNTGDGAEFRIEV